MIRTIEVSHWGNIAVEETIDMYHTGAKLKGSFSRFEYQREQSGVSSVKGFKVSLVILVYFLVMDYRSFSTLGVHFRGANKIFIFFLGGFFRISSLYTRFS